MNYLLPNDVVVAGRTFYLQFEAMLRTSDPMPPNLQFFAEFWDDTPGQQKVIAGGNFTITGSMKARAAQRMSNISSSRRRIRAKRRFPTRSISRTRPPFLRKTTAPSSFQRRAGFTVFDIYRLRNGIYDYLFRVQNSIEGTYYDVGNAPIRSVSGFPSSAATAPRAYAKTLTFMPGAIGGAGFVRHSLTIAVPTTYNSTLTQPNNQWLRMGLTAPTAAARQIVIRRVGLSLGDGTWSLSAEDNRAGAHSPKSTAVTSSPSGNSGGGVDPPPPRGSGGCVLLDCETDVFGAGEEVFKISLRDLKTRCRTERLYCDAGDGSIGGLVTDVKIHHAAKLYRITTTAGCAPPCSFNHPFITSRTDITGTPAALLKVGMTIKRRGVRVKIIDIQIEYGAFEVGIPILEGSHVCLLGDYDSHNRKVDTLESPY